MLKQQQKIIKLEKLPKGFLENKNKSKKLIHTGALNAATVGVKAKAAIPSKQKAKSGAKIGLSPMTKAAIYFAALFAAHMILKGIDEDGGKAFFGKDIRDSTRKKSGNSKKKTAIKAKVPAPPVAKAVTSKKKAARK